MKFVLALIALALLSSQAQAMDYPPGSTPVVVSALGSTAATSATLPAANTTIYLCGFSIRAHATASLIGAATITGLAGGNLNFQQFVAPVASGIGVIEMAFDPCLAGIFNTAVVITSVAPGAGGAVTVNGWGYRK